MAGIPAGPDPHRRPTAYRPLGGRPIGNAAMDDQVFSEPVAGSEIIGLRRTLLGLGLWFAGGLGFVGLVLLVCAPLAIIVFVAELPRLGGWLAEAWTNLLRLL